MKKISLLRRMLAAFVMLLAVMSSYAYSVHIEFIEYNDVQHTKWSSKRLQEYCSATISLKGALDSWKDVSKGDPVVITNFQSDFFSLKGFRCGTTNYYGDTFFSQTVGDDNTNSFGDMYVYIVVDALKMQPVATTSSSTYGTAKADRGSTSFSFPMMTMDFWDNVYDPDKWYIYYKATPTNAGKFVRWVPEKMITEYGSVASAISTMDYIMAYAEGQEQETGIDYTNALEYQILKKFKDPEFEIDVYEFEEFANICGVTPSEYYQQLRMRAVFEEKPTATVSASGDHGNIYSTTHTGACASTSMFSCRDVTFEVNKKDNITLNVRDIDDGYEFDHWTKNGSNAGSSLPWTFQVTGDVSVTAVFKQKIVVPKCDTVYIESDHGTVYDKNGNNTTYVDGNLCFIVGESTNLSLDIKDIDDGWEFYYWDVNNSNVGSDIPYSYTSSNHAIVTAVYKEETVTPPTPTLDSYVIVAQRKADANWFYMTGDLGTASTKRYQAVDAGTADITQVNTSNLDDIYYWQIEEDKYLKCGPDYSNWTSGNSAKFGPAIELTITQTDDYYTFSFVDKNNVTRYLSLNGTNGNNYFAYYTGTNQAYKLHLIKKGGSATGIDQIFDRQSNGHKLIQDGQLYILRDGKIYNVMGIEIK